MNNLTAFQNDNFGEVRTIMKGDTPYFCLSDVCKILEIGNAGDVKKRLSTHGVDSIDIGVQTGIKANGMPAMQKLKMNFINEPNLYRCIFQSRKPEAEISKIGSLRACFLLLDIVAHIH